MKKIYIKTLLGLAALALNTHFNANAQSLPVGTPVIEDYYRQAQLQGKVDSSWSFSIRPLFFSGKNKVLDVFDPDSSLTHKGSYLGPLPFAGKSGLFQVLPLTMGQQYNSHHPYGWNDGAMIPARGYQAIVSGGFFVKLGPLSVQLRPELVYAQNKDFDGFASGHTGQDLRNYFSFHNLVDQPERFGNGAYRKAFWGQSSIRLTFDPVSIGLSNENIWWGPGIQNALVLTNNAPGFKHLTLNTTHPIETPIGGFEGQLIAGKLEASGYPALLKNNIGDNDYLPIGRRNDWRYFTGINVNYHPRWVPGLTLGLIRTFNSYYDDVKANGFKAYFPFFTSYQKKATNLIGDPFPRDQITSVYARWLFTKAQAEIYFEYGLEDNSYNYRDFIGSPDHSRAYVFGLRKFLPLNSAKNQSILFGVEITQLSQQIDATIRETGLWYLNYQLTEGHTHQGQVLGAGIGSGGNIQSAELSWVSGLKKLGLNFQRYEHDADYLNLFFPPINGNSRKWVDFALGIQGSWDYGNFLFNAQIKAIRSLNYQWVLKDYDLQSSYYVPHNDVFNLFGQLGVTYRF